MKRVMKTSFTTEPKGNLYEPEYTDTKLHQMELERAEREERDRVSDKWWCTCSKCQLMPTEVESWKVLSGEIYCIRRIRHKHCETADGKVPSCQQAAACSDTKGGR